MRIVRQAASSAITGLQEKRGWKGMEDEQGQGRRATTTSCNRLQQAAAAPRLCDFHFRFRKS